MALILRIALGVVFTVSGFEKGFNHAENFLYVIQQYQVLPAPLDQMVSIVFPWIELLVGMFLILGLWLPVMLRLSALMNASLALLVGQAILRKLPIEDCGCFGELMHLPLQGVFLLDIGMLAAALFCLGNLKVTSLLSLDSLYAQSVKEGEGHEGRSS